ncbi:MAG UNVERIFIED_CONTAM: hypothetical protein LVQ98_00290 [Rickettsiaceae bacterium]|jgi:ABC-type multidrug transport system fused ATPase/permease subunit
MAILPVTIILVKFIGKKIRKLSVSSLKEKASLEEVISETLNNIKIIYTLKYQRNTGIINY